MLIKFLNPYAAFIISGAGAIALSQALSFGLYLRKDQLSSVLNLHAILLGLAGLAIMLLGNFVRDTLRRIQLLEKELADLKENHPSD
jgi:hypothetical protein